MPQSLSDWLSLLETRHPVEIELGLDRVNRVANRIGLTKPAAKTVTIAGTNGKGSCIAIMDCLLRASGLTTGVYTSPHLINFNERICIDGAEVSDQQLCEAFAVVEDARLEGSPVSLSYFEFTTLAALWLIKRAKVDVALLEIGLGGRLDAVNIVDADIAIVTSVALDHQAWLGNDIDLIGREKAAIAKTGKPLIYGDSQPVEGVLGEVSKQGAQLYLNGREFALSDNLFSVAGDASQKTYSSKINASKFPLQSLSCALQALLLLDVDLQQLSVNELLTSLVIPGRFQRLSVQGRTVIVDVAHNPAAANRLSELLRQEQVSGKVYAIFAVMDDKDIKGIVSPLKSMVEYWLLPEITDLKRAAKPQYLQTLLYNAELSSSIDEALSKAFSMTSDDDVILVCGSFYLAGPVLAALQDMETK